MIVAIYQSGTFLPERDYTLHSGICRRNSVCMSSVSL